MCTAVPMPLLRVVQYNPASTRTAGRLEDICQEFEKRDIIVLVGTQEKAKTCMNGPY